MRHNHVFSMAVMGIAIFALFLGPLLAHAIVVSDPTSYTYYVEQINKQLEQINKLTEQVAETKNVVDKATLIYDTLSGAYEYGMHMYGEMKRMKERMEQNPFAAMDYVMKWTGKDIPDDWVRDDGYLEIDMVLDDIFKDSRATDVIWEEEIDKQRHAQQTNIKKAIIEAEDILQTMGERMENLDELFVEIDATEDLKASQDLTNALLAEILKILTDHLTLAARYDSAMSMALYKGTSDETQIQQIERRVDTMNVDDSGLIDSMRETAGGPPVYWTTDKF